jgi:phosphocarrier protein
VKLCKSFASKISIGKGDKAADATRIIAVMGLGIKQGDTVTVTVEGEDEETAAEALESMMKETL